MMLSHLSDEILLKQDYFYKRKSVKPQLLFVCIVAFIITAI